MKVLSEHTISVHPLDITFVTPFIVGGQNVTVCINAFQPFTSDAGGGQIDLILGDGFVRSISPQPHAYTQSNVKVSFPFSL